MHTHYETVHLQLMPANIHVLIYHLKILMKKTDIKKQKNSCLMHLI